MSKKPIFKVPIRADLPPSLARYVLDHLDTASSSLGQAICRLVEHKPAYRLPQGTGGGVQDSRSSKTYLAKDGGRSARIGTLNIGFFDISISYQ